MHSFPALLEHLALFLRVVVSVFRRRKGRKRTPNSPCATQAGAH